MSVKRQATTELNHDNWDQEDPSESEEQGTFSTAPKEILEKRVIRTAKRRAPTQNEDDKKSVFSGFGGFNKPPPSSFDFLANLTNGNKSNGSPDTKNDSAPTSSLFGNKTTSAAGNIFNMPVSSPSKSTFGAPTSQSTALFGGSLTSTTQSPFTATKTDTSGAASPFKIQSTSNPLGNTKTDESSKTPNSNFKVTPNMFGIPPASGQSNKPLLSGSASSNTSPFKIQPSTTSGLSTKPTNEPDKDDKKLKYYAKLKGLNESVSEWIRKHVDETPLCILSPIFKDYEKYLKEIQDEYHGPSEETPKTSTVDVVTENKQETKPNSAGNATQLGGSVITTPFASTTSPNLKFGSQNSSASTTNNQTAGFSFGIKPFEKTATTTSSLFTLPTNTTTTTTTNGNAPFSFGIGKPFSFNSNVEQKPAEQAETNDNEEDEPPKVEFTPVVEENSVFDKRCKIFVKKGDNFADRGVGTLYVKKIEDTGKHQLLVRANTSLGNVLLNLILTSSIPLQRLGKNNVMLVCIPTPDAKPPPTPVLIRVKTAEEADELLETLKKFVG